MKYDNYLPATTHGNFTGMGQGKYDFITEAFYMKSKEFGDMIVIDSSDGAIYITKEQAMKFFDLADKRMVGQHLLDVIDFINDPKPHFKVEMIRQMKECIRELLAQKLPDRDIFKLTEAMAKIELPKEHLEKLKHIQRDLIYTAPETMQVRWQQLSAFVNDAVSHKPINQLKGWELSLVNLLMNKQD
jgi:transcriptional regulator with PAS, ATPase and Fis domain